MTRAVLHHGVLYPIDPLPPEWTDGKELIVAEGPTDSAEGLDRWIAEWGPLCDDGTDEDERRLEAALEVAKAEAKAFVKRQMGL